MKGQSQLHSPGDEECSKVIESELVHVDSRMASMYRALAARLNYLAQDRSDIQFATKEVSRGMANPTVRDWKRLKRLARYLVDRQRVVHVYKYQDSVKTLRTWSDSDHAGCKLTRKSTSAGVSMLGCIALNHGAPPRDLYPFHQVNPYTIVW